MLMFKVGDKVTVSNSSTKGFKQAILGALGHDDWTIVKIESTSSIPYLVQGSNGENLWCAEKWIELLPEIKMDVTSDDLMELLE